MSNTSDGSLTSKLILLEDLPGYVAKELFGATFNFSFVFVVVNLTRQFFYHFCRWAFTKGEEFPDLLSGVSRVPVVVIMSDVGESGKKGKGALLPQDWLTRVGAKTIAFNPVTTTNMVKLLTRIALEESQKGGRRFRVPATFKSSRTV